MLDCAVLQWPGRCGAVLCCAVLCCEYALAYSIDITPYHIGSVFACNICICLIMSVACRSYEDLDEAIDNGDVRSEGGQLPISFEQAFSLTHRSVT